LLGLMLAGGAAAAYIYHSSTVSSSKDDKAALTDKNVTLSKSLTETKASARAAKHAQAATAKRLKAANKNLAVAHAKLDAAQNDSVTQYSSGYNAGYAAGQQTDTRPGRPRAIAAGGTTGTAAALAMVHTTTDPVRPMPMTTRFRDHFQVGAS